MFVLNNLEELEGRSPTVGDGIPTSATATATAYSPISDTTIATEEEEEKVDMKSIVMRWNETGLPKVVRVDSKSLRGRSMVARVKEYGIDEVFRAMDIAVQSNYLRNAPWFDFDWFVKPNNFPKVLEGKYSRTFEEKKSGHKSYADMLREETESGGN